MLKTIKIDLQNGFGTITVDGVPLHGVTKCEFVSIPGKPAKLKLELLPSRIEVETDAEVNQV
jgi:hypothetical protein